MKLVFLLSFLLSFPALAECHPTAILSFRPTQMDVGFREVGDRTTKFQNMSHKKLQEYINKNPAMIVLGPKKQMFIFDHHHEALALYQAGAEQMCVDVQDDLSNLDDAAFWKELEKRNWVYLFDKGVPILPENLPADVSQMQDDPYRSLAWLVRKQGGYEASTAPFGDFKWADFFRSRVQIGPTESGFDAAVTQALPLAHSNDAKNLPGWTP